MGSSGGRVLEAVCGLRSVRLVAASIRLVAAGEDAGGSGVLRISGGETSAGPSERVVVVGGEADTSACIPASESENGTRNQFQAAALCPLRVSWRPWGDAVLFVTKSW